MKTIINSNGDCIQSDTLYHNIKTEYKEQELQGFANYFLKYMANKGFSAKFFGYGGMIQPYGYKDRFIYFAKSEFSGSSRPVTIRNNLEAYPEITKSPERYDSYNSIFRYTGDGKVQWFYLSAGQVIFERNYYDCKRISAKISLPVPYMQFIRTAITCKDEEQLKIQGRNGYILSSSSIDIYTPEKVIPYAFSRKLDENTADVYAKEITKTYAEAKLKGRFAEANRANVCIENIGSTFRRKVQGQRFFDIYLAVKILIKKNFDSYAINYSGNCISAQIRGREKKTEIFVAEENGETVFITGGQIARNEQELIQLISEESPEALWFTEKVRPNILTGKRK